MQTVAEELRVEGRKDTLLLQLGLNFEDLPEVRRRQVAEADQEEIDAILARLLTAGSVDGVFGCAR